MSKQKQDKTEEKRQRWVERTALALGIEQIEARELLDTPRQQSIRLNPLAENPERTLNELSALGWTGGRYAWFALGYTIETGLEAIRDSDLVADGKVYIQNAASWLPVLALDPQPEERILDVCAAPGGKTSHVAAHAQGRASIVANDNSRPRLAKLQATMKRTRASTERYTLFDATQLARKLEGDQFDKILLDAPCSGEGMMQLSRQKDFATWSPAQIKRLQQLQKRILGQAWQLLKPGGTLVYSTCTMAPEENEAVVDYFLRHNGDATVQPLDIDLPNRVACVQEWNGKQFQPVVRNCMRLVPSSTTEAFFVAVFKKAPAGV
jgi:NOL1/NOP2/sun family putative RNA methylase